MPAGCGRFRQGDRLRNAKDFRRVSRQAERRSSPSFVVLVAERGGQECEPSPRLGITVARRVGSAVERNRIKRYVREWFRSSRAILGTGVDLVVIARAGAARLDARGVERELNSLFEQSTPH